jgi:hypothetical protein
MGRHVAIPLSIVKAAHALVACALWEESSQESVTENLVLLCVPFAS